MPRSKNSACSVNWTSIGAPPSSCCSPGSPCCASACSSPTSMPSGSAWSCAPRSPRSPIARVPSIWTADPAPSVPARCSSVPAPLICSFSTPAASCAASTTSPPALCSPRLGPAASMSTPRMCRPPSSTMNTPEPAPPYRTLPAAHLGDPTAPLRWLLADLFLVGAAGILGGAPKPGKSFFALELAVAVASATAAAGRFVVAAPGPVLLCAAEDPPAVVVQRLAALAAARNQALAALPVQVIVEPGVRLPDGLDRLAATVAH